jgi:two-component system response regulator DevR
VRSDSRDPASPWRVTVCLVEDHEGLRELLCEFLADAGLRVLAAVGNVSEGEVAISAHRPDVAVIDNRLPDGRGIDLIRTLARTTPQVILLLHSGTVTDEEAREARQAGAAGVIVKTIGGNSLIEAIRNCGPARRS